MAKRKRKTEPITKLLRILPTAITIMLLCAGICLGALMETGLVSLTEVRDSLGIAPVQSGTGENVPEKARDFSVHVIDVGQGDSILILAGGKSILIDAGEKEYGESVVSYIRRKGISRLDYIIATHPHSDHIGGMAEVVSEIGADKIIVPRLPDELVPTTRVYEDFLEAVKDGGMKLTAAKAGHIYRICEIGGLPVDMTVLAPKENADFEDLNDHSVCVRLDFNRISWLFTGDLAKEGERALLNSGADIDVTAYKVGHHGSSGSSTEELLNEMTPRLCVISCGEGNSYGHPHEEAMERLEEHTDSIYRTDISSTLSFYSDGEKIYVSKTSSGESEDMNNDYP